MPTQPDPQRELVHQINNLLGVIYAQAAVARADPAAAPRAVELIERAAQETAAVVARVRRT